jgi:hypothetical protein
MNSQQVEGIARSAIRKAREYRDRDPRVWGLEPMVQNEMNAAGYAWPGYLDGSDRSIKAVTASLKRDLLAGRIRAVPV